jgi:serine/threonine protein kinase
MRGAEHLTEAGEFCGTFAYSSPEQIRVEEVDERSDLHSLAIVFYKLLAGAAPFTGASEYALMVAHCETPPPLAGRVPGIDKRTETSLMRALAKRPDERYASVKEFGQTVGAASVRGEATDILRELVSTVFMDEPPDATRYLIRPRSSDATTWTSTASQPSDARVGREPRPPPPTVSVRRHYGGHKVTVGALLAILSVILLIGLGYAFVRPQTSVPVVTAPSEPLLSSAPPAPDIHQGSIIFEPGTSTLSAAMLSIITRESSYLIAHPNATLTIAGYAQTREGTPDVRQTLAELRALNVRHALKDRGIDNNRLTISTGTDDTAPRVVFQRKP